MNHKKYWICAGLKCRTMLEFKTWIKKYAVEYFGLYMVVHSNAKKRYTVKCDEVGCP